MGNGDSTQAAPELADLFATIQRFTQRPKSGCDPAGLAVELIQLRHACDLLELAFSERAACFAATNEWEVLGSTTPIDWIRHNCNTAGSVAADRICVGRQLSSLPHSVAAVADGTIGFGHLSLIARTADAIADAGSGGVFDETGLLEQAKDNRVGKLRYLCAHYRHALDPAGMATDQARAAQQRCLKLSPAEDGSLFVNGWFDSTGGAALRTALEPLARKAGKDDDRGLEQRLADALVELATHALDTGVVPQRAGQRPHLQIQASLETLRGLRSRGPMQARGVPAGPKRAP